MKILIIVAAFAGMIFTTGCLTPPTPAQQVPKNIVDVSMTNGVFHIENPKSNVISNLDVVVSNSTAFYHFHADSIQDAMDANVVTMSGNSYAQSVGAQAAGYDKLLNDALNGAGAILGAAAKGAAKP